MNIQNKSVFVDAGDVSSVEQDMVRLVSNQSKHVPLPLFTAVVMIASIAASHVPLWVSLLWFTTATFIMFIRYRVLAALPDAPGKTPEQRLQLLVKFNLVGGVVHAASMAVFPLLSEAERALFSVVLMGLCTGAVATNAGYRPALLAYIAPIMVTLAFMWSFNPGLMQDSIAVRLIGLLLLFYSAVLLGLAREVNRGVVEAFHVRMRERELNQKLQTALDIAEGASRAKTRFLAAASHDLRQPLHTITMLGAALGMRPLDERSSQIVHLLNEVSQTFSDQLDGLLDISKLDAGVITADKRPVRLADLLAQHIAEIQSLIEAKHLKPILVCQTIDYVETDPLLLLRVLRNLTQNAIKFTDSGSITLEVRRNGAFVEVVVADTGPGIAPDQQDKVFQEFYQIGNLERDRAQGLGLGLSIVRRLVTLLGAEMQMQSMPGEGTSFVLRLPIAQAPMVFIEKLADKPADLDFGLCVLVVDDEKSVRASWRMVLAEHGCTCIEASGTLQAVQQIKHVRPDLVLADFRLRGSDSGLLTINAVHEHWPAVPAVLVSGDTAPTRLQEAKYAGIRLLHKPLQLDVFRKELSAAKSLKSAS